MILALSGKIKSGKSTVASIIQLLIANKKLSTENPKDSFDYMFKPELLNSYDVKELNAVSGWQQKSFAAKLKQIVALLIGCTVEQLEDQEFKSSPLGKDWIRYGYADGFQHIYKGDIKITQMINKECSKEKYEEEYRVNWQTAYKHEFTPRELMQFIGTDLFRDKLLNNIWVNALFADYQSKTIIDKNITKGFPKVEYPNWIITDVRFPNELQDIKERNGIVIRINRIDKTKCNQQDVNGECVYPNCNCQNESQHESERALDNTEFDYVIDNNSDIHHLIEEVRKMLIHFKII